jgi:hypothetical protein
MVDQISSFGFNSNLRHYIEGSCRTATFVLIVQCLVVGRYNLKPVETRVESCVEKAWLQPLKAPGFSA